LDLVATPADTESIEAADAFTVRQVARLLGLPAGRLRYWSQTGFIRPSVRKGARNLYSFRDLIAVKVAKALLDGGVPLRRVRRSLGRLSGHLPELDTSLANLRVRCEGDEVVVEETDHTFEAATGQLLIDFDLASLQQEATDIVTLPWVGAEGTAEPKTAYDWFLRGCELEEEWGGSPSDTEGFEAAKGAYDRAIELDPELAAAWTNLGSMYAELGDLDQARDDYDRALACDPDQPEAHCNLAELALREGDDDTAIEGYRQVLRLAPEWAEAHYGLARALLRVGGKAQALAHLERFCAALDAGQVDDDPELAHRRDRAQTVIQRLREELDDGESR
jgi:tetratricopeptide (TPR) repeat protein